MSQVSFAFTLAHELHGRLRWFGQLRWVAAGGLAVAALLGSRLGFVEVWPGLLITGLVVAAYNFVLLRILWGRRASVHSPDFLRACAIVQIALDLAALLVTVRLSGGMHSPVLPFFAFHMVIGTILLDPRTMYGTATATGAALLILHLIATGATMARLPDPNLAMITVTLFGTVYLTGRVTGRLKRGTLRLLETTLQLQDKTAQLEHALAEIREVERRKSHYMRLSAHQLRSPLGTIRTSLDVISQGFVDPASERGRSLIAGAIDRTNDLLAIVNDLLGLARIREGQAAAVWEDLVDLSAMLDEIVSDLTPIAAARRVTLTSTITPGTLLPRCQRDDLRFALENLVQNGIKYSREGGAVRISLAAAPGRANESTAAPGRANESTAAPAGLARITVADDGIGIPKELQPDIFLEFVRAPNAKHHAAEGTGLGLAIAREAIEAHGGRIAFESRENVGTTFTVELPIAPRA